MDKELDFMVISSKSHREDSGSIKIGVFHPWAEGTVISGQERLKKV